MKLLLFTLISRLLSLRENTTPRLAKVVSLYLANALVLSICAQVTHIALPSLSVAQSQIFSGISIVVPPDSFPDPLFSPISEGIAIDRDFLPEIFNFEAQVQGKVGSIQFDLNDGEIRRFENVAPYTLFGDNPSGPFVGRNLPNGEHIITVTAYSGRQGQGEILGTYSVSFSIYSEAFSELSFSFINPTTGVPFTGLERVSPGALVSLAELPSVIGIEAVAPPAVGSVLFLINGVQARIESIRPFSLFGDNGGIHIGGQLTSGASLLEARFYSGPSGSGQLIQSASLNILR
jgi:hypothetical protein